jgi:hypothetical protein
MTLFLTNEIFTLLLRVENFETLCLSQAAGCVAEKDNPIAYLS